MAGDQRISIDKDFVVAENGPLHLVIRAWSHDEFQMEAALEAARFAFACLEQVAQDLPELKQLPSESRFCPTDPVPKAMVNSVLRLGDSSLTPMASVAGAIADGVADFLLDRGCTRVIVDNGGDLAIRLLQGETARVGLRPDLTSPKLSHILELDGRFPSYGVNTSGLGGRSFTTGIATAATVLARTSVLADAAATSVANACFVPDPQIVQIPAGRLSPDTDIPGVPVTVQVGPLPPAIVEEALSRSLALALDYAAQNLIFGAFIAAGGQWVKTVPFQAGRILPVNDSGTWVRKKQQTQDTYEIL